MLPLQIASIIVVIRCQKKFLLVQRKKEDNIFPGKWQNLGGKIELGERVEEAIKREIKEEVGLEIPNFNPVFLQSYSWKKDDNSPVRLGLVFLIELAGKQNNYRIKPNKELASHGWFTIEETKRMNGRNVLIGKDSPTGTFSQLLEATK